MTLLLIRILVFVSCLDIGISAAREIHTSTAIFDELHCSSKDIAVFVVEKGEMELYIVRDQSDTRGFFTRLDDQSRHKGRPVRIEWFDDNGFRVVKKIRLIGKKKEAKLS